jgi:CRP-like cAMP-binding protein
MHTTQIELLQQMPIFGGLPAEALELLLENAPSVSVPAQAFFFQEGDPAVSMFVLERGSVSVLRGWRGRETLLRRLDKGDCFGEMALLDLFPRSASVRAEEDCRAIELTPAQLYRLFERDPAQFAMIQMNIAREMSRRLRETDDLLFRARMEGDAPRDMADNLHTI